MAIPPTRFSPLWPAGTRQAKRNAETTRPVTIGASDSAGCTRLRQRSDASRTSTSTKTERTDGRTHAVR